jgi:hypothetical protein
MKRAVVVSLLFVFYIEKGYSLLPSADLIMLATPKFSLLENT